MNRFAVLVLCPGATYSDLLSESRRRQVTVLEMIPFSDSCEDYCKYVDDGATVLFVRGPGLSVFATNKEEIQHALRACTG